MKRIKQETRWLMKNYQEEVVYFEDLENLGFTSGLSQPLTALFFFNNLVYNSLKQGEWCVCPLAGSHWEALKKPFIKGKDVSALVKQAEAAGLIEVKQHVVGKGKGKGKATEIKATEKLFELIRPARKALKWKSKKPDDLVRATAVTPGGERLLDARSLKRSRPDVKERLKAQQKMLSYEGAWEIMVPLWDVMVWLKESKTLTEFNGRLNLLDGFVWKGGWWFDSVLPLVLELRDKMFAGWRRRLELGTAEGELVAYGSEGAFRKTRLSVNAALSAGAWLDLSGGLIEQAREGETIVVCTNAHSKVTQANPAICTSEGGCHLSHFSQNLRQAAGGFQQAIYLTLTPDCFDYHTVYHGTNEVPTKGHGRLYSPFTTIPKNLRSQLIVKNNETGCLERLVEVDVPAAQPRLLYAAAGVPFPEAGWDAFPLPKEQTKAFFVYAIGSPEKDELFQPWEGFRRSQAYQELKHKPTHKEFEKLWKFLEPVHHLLFKSFWKQAASVESKVMTSVVNSVNGMVLMLHDANYTVAGLLNDVTVAVEVEWEGATGQKSVLQTRQNRPKTLLKEKPTLPPMEDVARVSTASCGVLSAVTFEGLTVEEKRRIIDKVFES